MHLAAYSSLETTAIECTRMGLRGAILTLSIVLLASWMWINDRQPQPYMDELFHIPQAARFCAKSPEYSQDITTPPMIYIIAAALSPAFGCSTPLLRLYSSIAAVLSLPLLDSLTRSLANCPPNYSWRIALIIASHPPLLFYSSFFYTDSFSLCSLLFTFYLSLSSASNSHVLPALAGLFSASIRQTNAIWHAFFAFLALVHNSHRSLYHLATAVAAPHAVAGILYALLFALNGFKVPLGDQARHSVVFHGIQLNIFAVYRLVFAFPAFLLVYSSPILLSLSRLRRLQALLFTALVSFILIFQTGDFVHPFILADNRHFMFYIYRKLFRRGPAFRYALLPLYTVAHLLPIATRFDLFALAPILITLLPSPLIEPRYFIPPFVISMLLYLSRNYKRISISITLLSCAFNLTVYFGLVFIFAEMPFERPTDPHMPNDLSPGRFML